MATLLFGSIDFSKLLEEAKKGNKAFSRGSNGKIYLNVNVWVNDEKDQFDNIASIQTTFKDATKDEKVYCGNLKQSTPKPITDTDIPNDSDLPF
ncbi:hypothetical protein V3Q77_08320 [Flavobacterium davisii]|uniref:DUF3127 domain-containing protein n=1 Tax=Flavobacterium davisii TaxID=2906077 RepID=A0ABW8PPJ5_9FLAO